MYTIDFDIRDWHIIFDYLPYLTRPNSTIADAEQLRVTVGYKKLKYSLTFCLLITLHIIGHLFHQLHYNEPSLESKTP